MLRHGRAAVVESYELTAEVIRMPPKVREVKRMLRKAGYIVERPGKGDHTVFYNPATNDRYALDGADSHELPKGTWLRLKRRLGIT